MKAIRVELLFLSAVAVRGDEPAPFANSPLRLDVPMPSPSMELDQPFGVLRLPIGPVRIDYSIPIPATGSKKLPLLDAPGPGYERMKSMSEVR